MKIQYCSDLHLEFIENKNFLKKFPLQPVGEILLLAGDIMLLKSMDEHSDFFDYCSDNFQETYWIPGNHEYYYSDLAEIKSPLFESIRENVFLLNNKTILYKNAELIFSTLWSHIPQQYQWTVEQNVSDFHVIKSNGRNLTAIDFNLLHKTDFDFLSNELAKPTDKNRIVITHHVPTLMNYPEQFKNSNINSAFATELYDFIFDAGDRNKQSTHWIYGHHHQNIPAFSIGNTQMLTNQLGYVQYGENKLFDTQRIVEL